ncbi:RNA 2',3'-cyclic phosphodiesterase [Desulfosarcina widdelii]|uniref:RNA 2',3'-cyclic phosphodiesterase n=1 Tax=Desulfosarcina widdelii TaxID=947919 RepID=A0A5K7Z2V1_9BACT|nr:RNA 2',3'-cyclic phosphodiesterase [Desulfosarcina widdelii]BBO73841.1 RNA 2',3'-cyclic phosphodiesterase [Desulfosarcina widdelii]
MKNKLRLFIAVPIPDAVTRFLKSTQTELGQTGLNIRWVPVENIHLTLKFLGDVDAASVHPVAERMDATAGANAPFELIAGGVGGFPNLRSFRVLWVGVDGDTRRLETLQRSIESELETLGHKKERRRFHPHLTLARTRQRVDGGRFGLLDASRAQHASEAFRVDRICLFASVLKPGGAEYTRLHASYLAG